MAIDSPQRLSVSAPVNGGYSQLEQSNGVTYSPATEQESMVIDIPLDWQRNPAAGLGGSEPGISRILNNDGTYPGFRIVYLQRLADPTQAYGGGNPYRTIDAMPVNLTTFNSASTVHDPFNTPGVTHFEARQRGDGNAPAGENNLWKQEPYAKNNWHTTGAYTTGLVTTLGYLNSAFGSPVQNGQYPGAPASPFPWLTFPYRPFFNEYELLQVPCVSSSQLLANNGNTAVTQRSGYGYVNSGVLGATGGAAGINVYTPTNATTGPASNFPYLLNFFDSGPASQSAPIGQSGQAAQFHRVLASLGVPSPFVHMSGASRA